MVEGGDTPSPYSAVKYQKGNEFMEEIALEHISKAYSGESCF